MGLPGIGMHPKTMAHTPARPIGVPVESVRVEMKSATAGMFCNTNTRERPT